MFQAFIPHLAIVFVLAGMGAHSFRLPGSNLASIASWQSYVLVCELAFLGILLLLRGFREHRITTNLLGGMLIIIGVMLLIAPGHPICAVSILDPANPLSRLSFGLESAALRHLIDPAACVLFCLLLLQPNPTGGYRPLVAAGLFLLLRVFESTLLLELSSYSLFWREWFLFLQFFTVQCFLVQCFALSAAASAFSVARARMVSFACQGMLLGASIGVATSYIRSTPSYTFAAHYYLWFPRNWSAGYAGQKLVPPITPELGEYATTLETFKQHLAWANDAGINLFILDWWPKRAVLRGRARDLAQSTFPEGFRFALHYESLDLSEKGDVTPIPSEKDVVYLTEERARRLQEHFVIIAKSYMLRENYFRIGDRPVLFLYASRHLVGPVRQAVDAAREAVRRETGLELYIVGDEVYRQVLSYSNSLLLRNPFEPDWDRLLAFDAITAYNPLLPTETSYNGSAGLTAFLRDTKFLYDRYSQIASTAGIDFIPTVLPGYNDRGVRPSLHHVVIPRDAGESSTLVRSIKELGMPFLTKRRNVLSITSWNEWNEQSQIEPSIVSEYTSTDKQNGLFSAGERYRGYGHQYLGELRDLKNELYEQPASTKASQ